MVAAKKLDVVLSEGIAAGRRKLMTSLSGIGARIAAKRAAHQAKADEWANRLDAIDAVEPALFQRGDLAVRAAEMDITDFENDLKELGLNLPPLPPSGDGSAKG